MTERAARSIERQPDRLSIGPSGLRWDVGRLVVDIDEWAFPLPRRMVGRISIDPGPIFHAVHDLDEDGRHRWRPVAPRARVTVDFDLPRLSWSGSAYVDINAGDEPIENAFRSWTWSRTAGAKDTTIFYDLEPRRGPSRSLALAYRQNGRIDAVEGEPVRALPGTLWRVRRSLRSHAEPANVRTFEDTPFYTRTGCLSGPSASMEPTISESVDLDRFASPWVRMLLPFRMPRRG